jgi:hypothetical protein
VPSANNGIQQAATRHIVIANKPLRIFSCSALSERVERITFIASCTGRVSSVVLTRVVTTAHRGPGGKNYEAESGGSIEVSGSELVVQNYAEEAIIDG